MGNKSCPNSVVSASVEVFRSACISLPSSGKIGQTKTACLQERQITGRGSDDGGWIPLPNGVSQRLYPHLQYLKQQKQIAFTQPSGSLSLTYGDGVIRRTLHRSLPLRLWDLCASSIGHAHYPGSQFFLLAHTNPKVHTLTTHDPQLKEAARDILSSNAQFETVIQNIQAVSLPAGFVAVETMSDSVKPSDPSGGEDDLDDGGLLQPGHTLRI